MAKKEEYACTRQIDRQKQRVMFNFNFDKPKIIIYYLKCVCSVRTHSLAINNGGSNTVATMTIPTETFRLCDGIEYIRIYKPSHINND